jgi:hypothetical protein
MLDDYPRDWLARHTIGWLLDEVGAPWIARNHLLLAVGNPDAPPEIHNTLGVIYLHRGALDRATQCFQETIERDPTNTNARENLDLVARAPRGEAAEAMETAGPVVGCTKCASGLPSDDAWPCAGCGMARPAAEPCSYCGAEGMAVPPLAGVDVESKCPICRQGVLVLRDAVPF